MDYQELGKWVSHEVAIGEEQLDLSDCSLWDWQCDFGMDASVLHPMIPIQRLPPDPFAVQCQDLLQDFFTAFDSENGLSCGTEDNIHENGLILVAPGEEMKRQERKVMVVERYSGDRDREDKAITFEEVSRYFYMPITQAAKELNMGLTQLKKKCRELGIPRWPHRKMKSLQALVKNVQVLGREDGEMGEAQMRQAIEILEREREKLERVPGMQLEERTKRLRQACFKANFKKRRLRMAEGFQPLATVAAAARSPDGDAAAAAGDREVSSKVGPCSGLCIQEEHHCHHQKLCRGNVKSQRSYEV